MLTFTRASCASAGGGVVAPSSTALVEQCYCRRVEVLLRGALRAKKKNNNSGYGSYAKCIRCGLVYDNFIFMISYDLILHNFNDF
jgi:hypothetical protein